MHAACWSRAAVALHWLLAIALLAAFGVGLAMVDLPLSPPRLRLFNAHKVAGVAILALSVLRLLWRLAHRPPADPPMPAWQARAAHAVHAALYGFSLAVPLSGWAYSSAAGLAVPWFGSLPLPGWVAADASHVEALKTLHHAFAFGLAALVALHGLAALKHQWIDRDGLLARMTLRRCADRSAR